MHGPKAQWKASDQREAERERGRLDVTLLDELQVGRRGLGREAPPTQKRENSPKTRASVPRGDGWHRGERSGGRFGITCWVLGGKRLCEGAGSFLPASKLRPAGRSVCFASRQRPPDALSLANLR